MTSLTPVTDSVRHVLLEAPLVRGRQGDSLQRQLLGRIRDAILDGRFPSGCRLPGSRDLAADLGVSRNSVTAVYEQLGAEGYIELNRRGTKVAALDRSRARGRADAARVVPPRLSERSAQVVSRFADAADTLAFKPGVPALARFPVSAWKSCFDRAFKTAGVAALGYGHPAGEAALRSAILRHLAVARGVRCDIGQVVITEGAQEALNLCVRLATNPGDTAWLEDPGYRGAHTAFRCGDLRVEPVRVDDAGLLVPAQAWAAMPPRLIYTTPSHQYPTGAVLPVARRLALIRQAQACGAWIIEDDYDSEFRHAGTFSKTLFPSLRLGFVVLPQALAAVASPLLRETLRGGHRHEQLALAEFIESGQFSRHLGRMRRLYRSRQALLRDALAQHLAVPHTVLGGDSGMHLTVRLPPAYPDQAIAEAARAYDMAPAPLSRFSLRAQPEDNGLVLGYGNTSESQYPALVQRLSRLAQAQRARRSA